MSEIIIREPKMEDAKLLLDYFNELMEEKTYLIYTEKLTLREEKEWLRNVLERMKKNQMIFLLAEADGRVIGTVRMERRKGREEHLVDFGIAVSKDYRGRGIGKMLWNACYKRAKKLWGNEVKYIVLHVFENNDIAQNFYRRLGFKEVARIPNAVKWNDGSLIAQIVMMREF